MRDRRPRGRRPARLKWLTGHPEALCRDLRLVDVWAAEVQRVRFGKQKTPCPACDEGRYEFLEGRHGTTGAALCGRSAVQVQPRVPPAPDFAALAARMAPLGDVVHNAYMLRLRVDPYELTLFPDGRAIIGGTDDPGVARALYARYLGG